MYTIKNKLTIFLCLEICLWSPLFCFDNTKLGDSLSAREKELIDHVKKSIINADKELSKLSEAVLAVPGMTSHKVKHLLNNLCSLANTTYLEIGVWQGATFTASLYANQNSIKQAVAIDNWSQFGGPYKEFNKNCQNFLANISYQSYSHECFSIDKTKLFALPIDIYFYDGDHKEEDQEKAFTYYDSLLAPTFIAIIDDWNHQPVVTGTRKAFEKLHYTILYETILPARYNGDTTQWWNGLYVAVIRR